MLLKHHLLVMAMVLPSSPRSKDNFTRHPAEKKVAGCELKHARRSTLLILRLIHSFCGTCHNMWTSVEHNIASARRSSLYRL